MHLRLCPAFCCSTFLLELQLHKPPLTPLLSVLRGSNILLIFLWCLIIVRGITSICVSAPGTMLRGLFCLLSDLQRNHARWVLLMPFYSLGNGGSERWDSSARTPSCSVALQSQGCLGGRLCLLCLLTGVSASQMFLVKKVPYLHHGIPFFIFFPFFCLWV